jgi:hypothetical protein
MAAILSLPVRKHCIPRRLKGMDLFEEIVRMSEQCSAGRWLRGGDVQSASAWFFPNPSELATLVCCIM